MASSRNRLIALLGVAPPVAAQDVTVPQALTQIRKACVKSQQQAKWGLTHTSDGLHQVITDDTNAGSWEAGGRCFRRFPGFACGGFLWRSVACVLVAPCGRRTGQGQNAGNAGAVSWGRYLESDRAP